MIIVVLKNQNNFLTMENKMIGPRFKIYSTAKTLNKGHDVFGRCRFRTSEGALAPLRFLE